MSGAAAPQGRGAARPVAPQEDRRLLGVVLMMTAFLLFTGIDSCAKWLIQAGLPPMQVVFVRFAGHVALVAALALPALGLALLRTGDPWGVGLRALCLLGSTICNFLAVQHLPLTLTSAIFFTMPLWICALSVPLLGERVGLRRWAAILVGFGGVLIATRPWSGEIHWAVVYSLAAALGAAFYAILTRRLAGVASTDTQQFYAAGVATLGVAPFAFADWTWPSGGVDWTVFLAIGVFGWAGHQVLTIAHRFAPASTLAPFIYSQIIFMTASSWVIFAQPPDAYVILGAAIVVAGGLYIWLRERELARAGRPAG